MTQLALLALLALVALVALVALQYSGGTGGWLRLPRNSDCLPSCPKSRPPAQLITLCQAAVKSGRYLTRPHHKLLLSCCRLFCHLAATQTSSTFILTLVISSPSILYLNPHSPFLKLAFSTLTVNNPCGTDLVCRLFLHPPRANTSQRTTHHSSLHSVPHIGAPYLAVSQDATVLLHFSAPQGRLEVARWCEVCRDNMTACCGIRERTSSK